MMTEQQIAAALEGKFFSIPGWTDEHRAGRPKKIRHSAPPAVLNKRSGLSPNPTLHDIMLAVASVVGVPLADLLPQPAKSGGMRLRREPHLTRARWVFFYLASQHTYHKQTVMGDYCGSDHKVVSHCLKRVRSNLSEFAPLIASATATLKAVGYEMKGKGTAS